jgi:hypothetical protein
VQLFFQSLSLTWTTVLVAVASGTVALLLPRIRRRGVRWAAAALLPFFLSYSIYWLPVWLGADGDRAQYSAWELLCVGAPFLAGLVASCLVIFIVTRYEKRHG